MIEKAKRMIGLARRMVAFSGAGLSAESGVPTFRDARAPSGALWEKFDPTLLASPQGFESEPEIVIDWYNWRRTVVADKQPNPAHRALANLPNVTQNVDDLLHRAGAKEVIQLHGTITRDRCHSHCGFVESIDLRNPPKRRQCPKCGARVRPDVVWFGEALPPEAWQRANECCLDCDLLLVVGTSAVVYPAAGLIEVAKSGGAAVIVVNTQPSEVSHLADIELIGKAGEIVPLLIAR